MSYSTVILYPEPQKAALSNLALHYLFSHCSLGESPDIFTFGDSFSLFLKKKLTDFDVICVSFSYEYSLFNFAEMLYSDGIPLSAKERKKGRYPLIIVGGPVVSLNTALFTSIFDLIIDGEGEEVLPHLKDAVNAILSGDNTVFERFSWLSSFEYPSSTRVAAPAREFGIFSDEKLLPLGNQFGNRVIIEMNRGCTAACRFCVASYLYRPFRPASLEKVKEAIVLAEKQGVGIALMGTSIGDYPEFDEVLDELANKKIDLSLSSLKGGAITEKRLKNLQKCGVKTVTLAVESADPAVRKQIAKPLPQQTVIDSLTLLFRYNFKVKLYFIAGLPHTDPAEEVAAISELISTLKSAKTLPHLTISVAPLSPKLLTPYANEEMMGKAAFRRYLSLLKKMVKEVAPHIAIHSAPYREAVVQTWITRTDEHSLLAVLDGVAKGLSIRDAERAAGVRISDKL